ncbi:MAG: PAS domain S-box protein [Bacteroidota bacterium]
MSNTMTNETDSREERSYQDLVHSLNGIVWESRIDSFEFLYISPQVKQILGFEPQEWLAEPDFWQNHIHPEDRETAVQTCVRETQKGRNHQFEYRMQHADGHYIWIRDVVTVRSAETTGRLRGLMIDITREKELEEEAERHLQTTDRFINVSPDLVGVLNTKGRFIRINQTFSRLLGFEDRHLINYPFLELVHPDDRENTEEVLFDCRCERGERVIEHRIQSIRGDYRWISWHLAPWGEQERLILYGRDIHQLKKTNVELRQLSLVASHANDSVVISNPEGRITWVNQAFEKLTGFSLSEVRGKKPGFLLQGSGTDRQTVRRLSEAVRKREMVQEEILNYNRDGKPYWLDLKINPVFNEKGECTEFIAIERDITRQKQEEQRLRLLESVVTNTNEAVVIIEAEPTTLPGRRILYVNQGFTRMTGYSAREVVGKTLSILNGPQTNEAERKKLRFSIRNYEPAAAEFVNYKKDGTPFWIHASMVPVRDKQGEYTHWISIGCDISERKEQQKLLVESLNEKETLLSEIHHRVKNNLAVVSGMMQLQAEDGGNEEVRTRLLESVGRVKTMATIHEQLYQSRNFAKLDFHENIRSLIRNIIQTFSTSGDIELKFACDNVELNINQAIPCSLILNEVVTNIMKYAFVGRGGGKILVSMRESGGGVSIVVEDDGVGLPEDFDVRKPNTLGMSLIDVLTEQLHGTQRYESPETGSRFILEFAKSDATGLGTTDIHDES